MALVEHVAALAYASPVVLACHVSEAPVHVAPDTASVVVTTLLHGEPFRAVEIGATWAWGYSGDDGYVGYVHAAALAVPSGTTTKRLTSDALVFAAPSIKSSVLRLLPMGTQVEESPRDGDFHPAAGGFIHHRHLGPLPVDPVAVALCFLGAPYRWGGRTRAGIDCSGLIQAALTACGVACPRDSDQQCAVFPHEVALAQARRGDLLFLPGHVGIFIDAQTLLHANAYWMQTVIEPVADVLARQQPGGFRTVRRVTAMSHPAHPLVPSKPYA